MSDLFFRETLKDRRKIVDLLLISQNLACGAPYAYLTVALFYQLEN